MRPLEGFRVVDFSTVVAGPWCTRLLADCGAEVIKIESPDMGDVLRFSEPVINGQSRVYAHFNCGKKNIAINLKASDGVALAKQLAATADVIVENFRPGVMQRLGLDYAAISALKPDVIYCSVSGFGQTGPMATLPAYAPVLHAASGFDHVMRIAQDSQAAPLTSAIMVADYAAASYAFGAIQTALIARLRQGRGAYIDVSLMDSMLTFVAIQCQEAQSDRDIRSTTFRPYQARDGHVMIPLVNFRNFQTLIEALDLEGFRSDPRMQTFSGVLAARSEILTALARWTEARTVDTIIDHLQNVGLPCARYCSPKEVIADPLLTERGSFAPLRDANGPFTVVNAPFRIAGAGCDAGSIVAALGEHTDVVLTALGMTLERIHDLRADGVIV